MRIAPFFDGAKISAQLALQYFIVYFFVEFNLLHKTYYTNNLPKKKRRSDWSAALI